MSNAVLVESLPDGSVRKFTITELQELGAQVQANYTLIDEMTQQPPEGMRLIRQGEDLNVEIAEETVATIADFYAEESTASFTVDGSLIPTAGTDSLIIGDGSLADVNGEAEVVWSQESGLASGDVAAASVPWWGYVAAGAVVVGGGIAMSDDNSSSTSGGDLPDAPAVGSVAFTALRPSYIETDEGTVTYEFKVERSEADSDSAASVDWSVAGSGTDAANAADFGGTLPSGTVNFAAGELWQILSFTVSGDTDLEPDETFTVTLSDPDSSTATGTIFNDEADPLVLTLAETDYTTTSGGDFVINNIGGDGDDALSVNYSAPQMEDWDISLDGAAGNDSISVDLAVTDYSANSIDLQGGEGNDSIAFNHLMPTASADIYNNEYTIDGGGGHDSIYLAFDMSGTDATDFDFDGNVFNLSGGTGNDLIVLEYNMTDVVMTAGVTGNEVNLFGEAGDDTLIVDWNDGYMSTESIEYNQYTLDGGDGNDSLHFEWWIQSNPYSSCENNDINLIGGSGDDALVVELALTDMDYSFYSNDVTMSGGDGDDSLSFSMMLATAESSCEAAHNVYSLDGGSGNDVIDFSYTGTATASNEEVSISGGDGIDNISVAFDVTSANSNAIEILAGEGEDNIAIDVDGDDAALSFRYGSPDEFGDSITGLTTSNDFTFLFASGFNGNTTGTGYVVANSFVSGADAVALDADDYWIYDTTSFELSYDADGSGAGAAQVVASFDANVDIGASHIHIDSPS